MYKIKKYSRVFITKFMYGQGADPIKDKKHPLRRITDKTDPLPVNKDHHPEAMNDGKRYYLKNH